MLSVRTNAIQFKVPGCAWCYGNENFCTSKYEKIRENRSPYAGCAFCVGRPSKSLCRASRARNSEREIPHVGPRNSIREIRIRKICVVPGLCRAVRREKLEVLMPHVRFALGIPLNPHAGLGARERRHEKFSCRVYAGSRREIFGTRNSEFHVFMLCHLARKIAYPIYTCIRAL